MLPSPFQSATCVRLGHDAELTACHRKSIIDPGRPAVDDHQVRTISREQTVYDLLGEVITTPMAATSDLDTHVQIMASDGGRNQAISLALV